MCGMHTKITNIQRWPLLVLLGDGFEFIQFIANLLVQRVVIGVCNVPIEA